MDGTVHGAWVVLDFFDVIVHVMRQDVRERYDLEGLWGDAKPVKPKESENVEAIKPKVKVIVPEYQPAAKISKLSAPQALEIVM